MKSVKKIMIAVAVVFMALITSGCYNTAPPLGVMNLCIYADDIIDLNLVINASDSNGDPFRDDVSGAVYADYIVIGRTAQYDLPNECESQRPYHIVRLKAPPGSTIAASIRVTGPTHFDHLTCVYFVNGVQISSTRTDSRNTILCRLVAIV